MQHVNTTLYLDFLILLPRFAMTSLNLVLFHILSQRGFALHCRPVSKMSAAFAAVAADFVQQIRNFEPHNVKVF